MVLTLVQQENSQNDYSKPHVLVILSSEATILHVTVHIPIPFAISARISCRSDLNGTEKNKICLSQKLRMGLSSVTILYY